MGRQESCRDAEDVSGTEGSFVCTYVGVLVVSKTKGVSEICVYVTGEASIKCSPTGFFRSLFCFSSPPVGCAIVVRTTPRNDGNDDMLNCLLDYVVYFGSFV